jgi:hypothetical protein
VGLFDVVFTIGRGEEACLFLYGGDDGVNSSSEQKALDRRKR